MSATAMASIPATPIKSGERIWTGNFTEDHNKWPEPTREELWAAIKRIEAERPELYGAKPEQVGD